MRLQPLTIKDVDYLLHIKLVFFLATGRSSLSLCPRCLFQTQFLQLFLQLELALLAGMLRQYLKEEMQQVDDGIGIRKELIMRKRSSSDGISLPTDLPFELWKLQAALCEDCVCDEDMEKLLLDFGVEKDLVGDMRHCCLLVDVPQEPALRDEQVHRSQRDHILALKFAPAAHALLVGLTVTQFAEVLDEGDEDVLGIVFLKFGLACRLAFREERMGGIGG